MPDHPITVDRIERALAIAAHVVTMNGEIYIPTFERPEREMEEVRRRDPQAIERGRRSPARLRHRSLLLERPDPATARIP